jgi:hypothetical protein
MTDKKKAVLRALAACMNKDGILYPAVVVQAARDPKSPLHSLFQWDDSGLALIATAQAIIEKHIAHDEVKRQ